VAKGEGRGFATTPPPVVGLGLDEQVNHPAHYGGKDDPFEAIKVIEAWELGFHLGNTVKYISRCGKKGAKLTDLEKALWYLERKVKRMQAAKAAEEKR